MEISGLRLTKDLSPLSGVDAAEVIVAIFNLLVRQVEHRIQPPLPAGMRAGSQINEEEFPKGLGEFPSQTMYLFS
jgi:hypothetical protein